MTFIRAFALIIPTLWFTAAQAEDGVIHYPYYVSVKAQEANMRTGPGTRYPITWVYSRRHLPMQIMEAFGHWRHVKDVDGDVGWMHHGLLSRHRTGIITTHLASLHREADRQSPVIMKLEKGVIGHMVQCQGQWCRMQFDNMKGWLHQSNMWGKIDGELIE